MMCNRAKGESPSWAKWAATRAGERLLQYRLHAQPQVSGVTIARHEDQTRHEALEIVLADEQRHPLAILQVQDSEARVEQTVLRYLEEFVPREGLQDIHEGLAVVAPARESGALDDVFQLAPQERNVAGTADIGDGREQADEHVLADYVSLGVEALDADGVQVHGAVHRRAQIRLRHHEQIGPAQ